MFEEIYKLACEKLNYDIRHLVSKLYFENERKPRSYRDGLIAACEAFISLASDSSGDLIIALERESEKEADYFLASEPRSEDSSNEQ